MSCLAFESGELEIFQICNKECGIITASDDQQYFSLNCLFCSEKFLYFDAFISHIQTEHAALQKGTFPYYGEQHNESSYPVVPQIAGVHCADDNLLIPEMVMVKQERPDNSLVNDIISGMPTDRELEDAVLAVKQEQLSGLEMPPSEPSVAASELEVEDYYRNNDMVDDQDYQDDMVDDNDNDNINDDDDNDDDNGNDAAVDDNNYNDDDLLEEALLDPNAVSTDATMHIKDRKMIQFLIDSYKRNPFLWDKRHPKFRCRVKRANFLNMIINEFKRRFNITLAKDAITRKWDNLRTVYKRECNRMSKEKSSISTLWYFKDLQFLSFTRIGYPTQQSPQLPQQELPQQPQTPPQQIQLQLQQQQQPPPLQPQGETLIQDNFPQRRFSSYWTMEATNKLLYLVSQYPCFWDKYNVDYRSKERRGEALQHIVSELQSMMQVSPIQISKRMSHLRFEYSKQKHERLICESNNRTFVPSFSYYEQMNFMDHDILPFKCEFCGLISQTTRESELHLETHNTAQAFVCTICHMSFGDVEQYYRHKRTHLVKELKYHCDTCAVSFMDRTNYNEHMRRHSNEMQPRLHCNECGKRFPTAAELKLHMRTHAYDKPFICDVCGKPFANTNLLHAHRTLHSEEHNFKCDYAQCCKTFQSRKHMLEHMRLHFSDEEHKCEVCGKLFKSVKNLQNHKQIHDAVKKYICKICGSAFAQAAGLYLHKRRHNRQMQLKHNWS